MNTRHLFPFAGTLMLSLATSHAATLVIDTDNAKWRVLAPYGDQRGIGNARDYNLAFTPGHPGWNTNASPAFDDSGWGDPTTGGDTPDGLPELNLTHSWFGTTNSPVFFRRTFFIPGTPQFPSVIHVSVLNSADVYVNDQMAFNICRPCGGGDGPGYASGTMDTYLRPGFNVLTVVAHTSETWRPPYMALRLMVDYAPEPRTVQVGPAPGGGLTLRWPEYGTNVVPVATASLSPPIIWTPVTNQVVFTNGILTITVPYDQPARFFQLQEQQP